LAPLALGLALVAGQAAAVDAEPAARALPLGPGGLSENRTSTQVTPGVTHTRIVRGENSPTDAYVVDVGFRPTRTEARQLERRLQSDGFAARFERIRERAPDDPRVDPLGYLVRVGDFASPAEATETRDRLATHGYTGLRVVYSGEDGRPTTGPWVVNVLEVDPAVFEGSLGPALATQVVPGLERLTALASNGGALAAVNGGYFVIGPADGTPGDLAGISVLGGALVSEAVNGRTSLIMPPGDGAGADVAALSTRQVAQSSDGAKKLVDGLNRKPGLIRGCGGRGDDVPTGEPKHDFTCTDGSELILFTPSFGASTEPGEGTEAALDAGGTVIEVRSARGGTIPPGGSVLSGTGRSGNWLRAHARPGGSITVRTQVLADDRPLDLAGGAGVVNGGPRLVREGQVEITAAAEGFHWEENPEFYYRFGVRRNPRTLAGVTAEGKVLLVTVDGRRPGVSVGASFQESGRIMQALGAVEAVNLDGGGSTAMVVGEDLVNTPSDASGERAIADAVVIRGQ
jgi:hypothetical protein